MNPSAARSFDPRSPISMGIISQLTRRMVKRKSGQSTLRTHQVMLPHALLTRIWHVRRRSTLLVSHLFSASFSHPRHRCIYDIPLFFMLYHISLSGLRADYLARVSPCVLALVLCTGDCGPLSRESPPNSCDFDGSIGVAPSRTISGPFLLHHP